MTHNMNGKPQPGRLRLLALVSVLSALSGCAIVASTPQTADAARSGVAYMLPKALLPLELVEADGVLMLRMQPAIMVGDPTQRYFVAHVHNAFASDEVTISVDPQTAMLTGVAASGDDKSLAVLSEVLKTSGARRIEGGTAESETVLFRGLLDPDGATSVGTPNGRLIEGLQRALLKRVSGDPALCGQATAARNCLLAERLTNALAANATPEQAVVVAQVTALGQELPASAAGAASSPRSAASAPRADCGTGVCYRSLQPFVVELAIKDVYAQSTVVLLPNGTDPVALPLDRAPFVKTEYTIQFSGGQLQSVQTKRPSSALALVKWPLEIYQSVLEATATLIQLRIGANTKEVALAQSQLDTAKELKRLREEMEKVSKEGGEVPAGGTILGGPRRGDALLAIELGQRPSLPRNVMPTNPPNSGALPGQPNPGTLPGQPNPGTLPGQPK